MMDDVLTCIETMYQVGGESSTGICFITPNECAMNDMFIMPKEKWIEMEHPQYINVRVTPVDINGVPLHDERYKEGSGHSYKEIIPKGDNES